jgi:uncharacterized protein YjlB
LIDEPFGNAVVSPSVDARAIPGPRLQTSDLPKHVRGTGQPLALMFADDGVIPNNPTLPFLLYAQAIAVTGKRDPAAVIERVFKRNGWGDMWRNGIYGFVHYHSAIHEVLGVAQGRARVQFGGDHGQALDLMVGDVAILPAGTGHRRLLASEDFLLVGAYPPEGKYDLCRSSPTDRSRALVSIPKVPLPESDPVYGPEGPLLRLWRR